MGLRDKKKKIIRENILKAAGELFFSQGYEETTTDQIAEKAEVGAGTVYNYFKSKAEIFIEVFAEQFPDAEDPRLGKTKRCAAEIIYNYIEEYAGRFLYMNKKLMRELMAVGLVFFKSRPKLFRKMMDMDYRFMNKLEVLINQMKESCIIESRHESRVLVEMIYSFLTYDYMLYIFEEDISLEMTKKSLFKKLRVLFNESEK